jgi:hypothetical protein
MTTSISFRPYVDSLRVGAQYAKPVARLLVHSAPEDMTTEERTRLMAANALANEIGGVIYDRSQVSSARVRQPLLNFTACMGAFHNALEATASVPEAESTRSKRAKELMGVFFPEGLSFTKLDAFAAWFEGDWRFQAIEADGLTEEMTSLTGPDIFPAAKRATVTLGEALGVGETRRDQPASRALQHKLMQFSRKVSSYLRLLSSSVDEDNEASVQRFLKAVAPIDQYRRGRAASEEEEIVLAPPAEEPAAGGTNPNGPAAPSTPTSGPSPGVEPDPSVAPGGPFGPTR